jgi:Protein of unknown function (DUF3592)
MRYAPMTKTLNILFGLFLAFGLAFCGASLWAVRNTQSFVARAETAAGQVINLEYRHSTSSSSSRGTYYPVVKFKTATGEERTLHSNTGSSPPSYAVGEAVTVLYDPGNPFDARIKGFFSLWLLAIIFGALGSVFSLIGLGGLFLPRYRARQAQELKLHGTPIETEFQNVELNGNIKMNGRSPWRIVSRWLDPARNELHLFHSENLWFDPTPFIKSQRLTVFVDPNNFNRYAMDVSFLPKVVS